MTEKEFWKAVQEFQKEFEQLKQDIERTNQIRRDLDEFKLKQR